MLPLLAVLFALTACAGPAERYRSVAEGRGLATRLVDGAGFTHAVFERPDMQRGERLHVYLEGDGSPYLRRRTPAPDPTPRKPLALGLMARDSAPALLLGRPCYHGSGGRPPCTPELWTEARYGESVLTSLEAALARLLAERDVRELVLIGHSGGGTLALLLAPRIPQTVAVVTVAANLDLAAWSAHHGDVPLSDSLDPARLPALDPDIVELHLVGARDRVVPAEMLAGALSARAAAAPAVVESFDHVCCWEALWPEVLDCLGQRLHARLFHATVLPEHDCVGGQFLWESAGRGVSAGDGPRLEP